MFELKDATVWDEENAVDLKMLEEGTIQFSMYVFNPTHFVL